MLTCESLRRYGGTCIALLEVRVVEVHGIEESVTSISYWLRVGVPHAKTTTTTRFP